MGGRVRRAGWLLALAWTWAGGAEPDGALTLRAVWEDGDHLRVTVHAIVPLEQVVLTWTGPEGFALKAEIPEGAPPDKTPEVIPGGERMAVPQLAAGSVQTLRLRVEGARGEDAVRIGVIRVDAILRGLPVREALGIPLATPDGGRLRGDVLEFPAAAEP